MEDGGNGSTKFHQPANISEELVNFARTKIHSPILEKLFRALKTIPPSSIESERAFSITGQFVTKLRSTLGDDSIDALVFLKSYYKNKPKDTPEILSENEKPKTQPETPKVSKLQSSISTPVAGPSNSQSETPKSSRVHNFTFKRTTPKTTQPIIESEDLLETQMRTE